MKILVTGGAGFIGSHIVEHYQSRAEVVVLDNLRSGREDNLAGMRCEFVHGSILDAETVDAVMRDVDLVFHLAAFVSVAESMSKPIETVNLNVHGLLNVLEAASAHQVRKLCFASSAAVYGENPEEPKRETMSPDPRSPYAITKLDGEYFCELFSREKRVPTAAIRFFNVFGPRQDPNSAYAAAVPNFFARARANQPITIFGDGKQTRDFIFVKDIVGALVFAAENPDVKGVFNAGYGISTTIFDLAQEIIRLTGSKSEIIRLPVRPGDIRHSTSDASRLHAAGWWPEYDVTSALKMLADLD